MFYLTNRDANLKLGFDFLNNLPDDFDIARNKSEKWVPFVMNISTPEKTIAITEKPQAYMTVYEVEKIYNGIKNLLDSTKHKEDKLFTHYSYESIFEISVEYLHVDECFEVVLWFIIAECPEGKIEGYNAGFRFIVDKFEMEHFIGEFYYSFKEVCPQCSISEAGIES